MPWKDSVDFINEQIGDPDSGFGDRFTYCSLRGTADPLPFNAIRVRRSPDEFNPTGSFEGLEIRGLDFTAAPPAGLGIPLPVTSDVVWIDSVDYVVTSIRDQNPTDGIMVLILSRRAAIRPAP